METQSDGQRYLVQITFGGDEFSPDALRSLLERIGMADAVPGLGKTSFEVGQVRRGIPGLTTEEPGFGETYGLEAVLEKAMDELTRRQVDIALDEGTYFIAVNQAVPCPLRGPILSQQGYRSTSGPSGETASITE